MNATHRQPLRTAVPRSDQETCACGLSKPTSRPRSSRLTLAAAVSGHSPPPTGHREPQHINPPHMPPYDSTPILIDRVRRKRQRLRSNGSIGSDSAAPPHRSCAHLRAESPPIESYRYSGPTAETAQRTVHSRSSRNCEFSARSASPSERLVSGSRQSHAPPQEEPIVQNAAQTVKIC
jgi:hypothetical protein